jgi:ABC-2 type transport system permease protein
VSQLFTLIWLKWRLLRNSLRSSKAVVNKVASVLGMLVALVLSSMLSLILGIVAYALSQPETFGEEFRGSAARGLPTMLTEFIFFSFFGFLYLMWATVPLSIGGTKQFDAGKLLMYPITLRKLFLVDFASELTTLHSVFAVPAVLAIAIGAGLGSGNLPRTLPAAIPAILFGVALSKWLATIIGSLLRRKRARGETIIALIGALAGLGGAAAGQVAPLLFKHAESVRSLRWTPPGAAAFLLIGHNTADQLSYALAFLTLSAYAAALIFATYWMARRAALGLEGRKRRRVSVEREPAVAYTGWKLPLISAELSAVVEKEIRYLMRNAQVRMMALMPLILILVRFVNTRRFGTARPIPGDDFLSYSSGLFATGGILYVFLILAGLSCNLFAFEEGGMRTLILSPVDRRKILLGKNIAMTVVAFVFSVVLVTLNTIVFGDLVVLKLPFLLLSFVSFAALNWTLGNWLSIHFPKRMRFGKRLNVSGMGGLLLIPMVLVLAVPPILATVVGYVSRSLLYEDLTLALFAVVSVGIYFALLNLHGRTLARREIEVLEAVREPTDV